jgi:hypothetical protein
VWRAPWCRLALTRYFSEFPRFRLIGRSAWRKRGIAIAGTPIHQQQDVDMPERTRNSKTTWIIIAVIAIVVMLFAGLLPLPGQKDKVTPHVQPSPPGTQPQVEAPKGPPPSPPSEAGAGTQPPPGGTPAASPGGATNAASGQTMTDSAPKRDPR